MTQRVEKNEDSTRVCTDCRVRHPLNEHHFHRLKDGFHGFTYRCKPCEKIREKGRTVSNRRRQQRYVANNPVKVRARREYRNALNAGRIKREPCRVCGEEKSEGHHNDYTKPLEVVWLCKKCHISEHYE